MGGDLGNLLTGELGEAEARFSHEDFAGVYGRRVAHRVRRRRTVRAAGVGGGTMLTAGALAVGASNVPWGSLGAAPGAGVADCVTPPPSDAVANSPVRIYGTTGEVIARASATDRSLAGTLELTDSNTGTYAVKGVQQPDGTVLFYDADGNPVPSFVDSDGRYLVNLQEGESFSMEFEAAADASDDQAGEEVVTIWGSVTSNADAATAGAPNAAALPSPSDDCYTPSPAPSASASASAIAAPSEGPTPDPTLAAKPEDVVGDSPFECGFEFPTESYGADDLWIDGVEWFTQAEVEAEHLDTYGTGVNWGSASQETPVARATVHLARADLAEAETASGVMGTGDPSLESLGQLALDLSAKYVYSEGRTFVGVLDGKVVATGTLPSEDEAALASIFTVPTDDPALDSEFMYLISPSVALTSCDANPVDLAQVDIVAVAGAIVKYTDGTIDGPTYAWLPVGTPED